MKATWYHLLAPTAGKVEVLVRIPAPVFNCNFKLDAVVPYMAKCQSCAEARSVRFVSLNQREAKMFQPSRRFPGLIQVSTVIEPADLPTPTGNTAASPLPSIDMLAPVESLTLAAFPKNVPVSVDVAGLTLFQPVAPVAAIEDVLLASRFRTKLLVTIAALADGGVSRNVNPDASSATSATKDVPFRRNSRTLRYTLANI